MTRLVAVSLAALLLFGVVGVVRLSGGGVASQLAAVAGIDIGDPVVVGDAPSTPTPAPVPVRVRVRDAAGRAVADAPVEVQDRFGRVLAPGLATDTRGEARFAARPTEGVTIRARKAAIGQARVTDVSISRLAAGQGSLEIDLVLVAVAPEPLAAPTVGGVSPTPLPAGLTPQPPFPTREGGPTAPVATPARPPIPRRLLVGHVQPRLSMIDVASATGVGPPVDLGTGRLTHVAAAASGRRVFASWGGSSEVLRLRAWDLAEEGRLNLEAGAIAGIATSPADGHLWIATAGVEGQPSSNVVEVDPEGTRVLRRLEIDRRPGTLRFSRDGSVLGVAHRATSELSLVDPAAGTVGKPMRLPIWAGDYQFTEDGATILVANQSSAAVYAVDRSTGEARRTYDAGFGVASIATIPGTTRFLATSGQLGLVQSFDAATGEVRDVVPVGLQPQAILVTEDGRRAYVANAGSASVSAIDLATMTVTDVIATGNGANALAITPADPRPPPPPR